MPVTLRHILVVCLIAVSAGPLAFAQKVGTTSMQFLRVHPVARAASMGDAYASLASGADALFWNPGGVSLSDRTEITTTYIDWLFDTQQGALGFSMPFGTLGTVGVQVQYVDYGAFDEAIANQPVAVIPGKPGLTGRQFRPYSVLVGLGYSKRFTDKFSAGLNVKIARESLFDQATTSFVDADGSTRDVNTFANGMLFDFGLLYNTGYRSIRIAGVIQNFGNSLTYAKEASPAPLLFRLGFAADLLGANGLFSENEESRVTSSFELFQPNDYSQQIHVGLEYMYASTIALRAGYKFNYDTDGLTLGGGVIQEVEGAKISIDYSYGSMGPYLETVHRISLGARLQ